MGFNQADWIEMTGTQGRGSGFGFARPMRDPSTRQMVRPFAASPPARSKSPAAMTQKERARERRRLLSRFFELEAVGRR